MSARIDRTGKAESEQGARISLHPYTGGSPNTETSLPDVPDTLLRHLRKAFPKRVPPLEVGVDPTVILAKAWGREEVIEYLEHIHSVINNATSK